MTAAIQNIALTIAALIGAYWAAKTYMFEHPKFYQNGAEVAGVPITGSIHVDEMTMADSRIESIQIALSHKSHLTEIVALSDNPLLIVPSRVKNGKGRRLRLMQNRWIGRGIDLGALASACRPAIKRQCCSIFLPWNQASIFFTSTLVRAAELGIHA